MLKKLVAEREEELPVSTIGKFIKIAEEGKGIISLGAGELDFEPGRAVLRAAKKGVEKGSHYSAPQGRADLREALARKLRKENKIKTNPEGIIVTNGATEGIFLTLLCTMDLGEGVMIPDPGFLAYKPAVEILGGMPISVPLQEGNGFVPEFEEMEKAIMPEKTKAIILNSPANPTGAVYGRKTLEEIADFANQYDLLVISDEVYEKFVYEGKHVSIGSLNGMEERTVSIFSFSKTFAMPGFRIGYATGPEKIIKAMSKVHVLTSICAPTAFQMAGLKIMKEKREVERMVGRLDKRRRFVGKRLGEMGIEFVEPKGAFYFFPGIRNCGMKSMEFSEKLLKRKRVAVVPGTEFGRRGEGFVRISYATPDRKLETALDRIEGFVKGLK